MRAIRRLVPAVAAVGIMVSGPAVGAADLTPAQAKAIAVEAYVYTYPLVMMDMTRRLMTNVPPGREAGPRPDERLPPLPDVPAGGLPGGRAAELRHALLLGLARPDEGADGPLDPGLGRPLLPGAAHGHVDRRLRGRPASARAARPRPATPSSRPAGPGRCPPGSSGSTRRRSTTGSSAAPRRTAPPTTPPSTRSRTASGSRRSRSGASPRRRPRPSSPDPTVDMKTPPPNQVDGMTGDAYFAYAAELMKLHEPHAHRLVDRRPHEAARNRPRPSFDFAKVDPVVRQATARRPGGGAGR